MSLALTPAGPKPQHFSVARLGVYAFLVISAAFFLILSLIHI